MRKSPIKHKVRSHIRKGKKVQTYNRGTRTILWKNSKGKTDFSKSLIRQIDKSKLKKKGKICQKGEYGYNVRLHHGRASQKVVNALEEVIDQIQWRKREWGLIGDNPKKGMTHLIASVLHNHHLNKTDRARFLKEISTRRYSYFKDEI